MRLLTWALVLWTCTSASRADTALHSLWELHGKHNTVFLLGSIHVLRPGDYPLSPAVMLASATLPEGKSLPEVLGPKRYSRAESLARDVGVDLATFDQFAPWFAAEAISQLQLLQLGFQPTSGVEMYFLQRARSDGKSIAGLETVHDQIALFEGLSMDAQAEYLVLSLEQAHELPKQVDDMVHAWQRGDTAWFDDQMRSELGRDPALYQSVLAARNRKWIPKIEALLNDDKNYLVIVGTGHLVGRNSVIDLLKKDGVGATQR